MDPMLLLDILDSSLSEDELTTLCRRLGVAYDVLPGGTKRDKTREFLGFMARQGRLAGLADATVALRPDLTPQIARLSESRDAELAWLDQVAAGEGQSLDSGLTWRWPSSSSARERATISPTPKSSSSTPNPPPIQEDERDAPATTLENPYSPGAAVDDDSMFFGRLAERDHIVQQLREGQHAAVVGSRGIGASSLLRGVFRDIATDKTQLAAYIDMKQPANHTLPGLLNAIWAQWWERVRPGNTVIVPTLAEFVTAVRKLNAAGFRPVLFLDELEQLVWRPDIFDDKLLDAWLELGREGVLTLAVTAHTPPAELLAQAEYHSLLYELFQPITLGLLEERAARDLLAVPLRQMGLKVPDGVVEVLFLHAGSHPFFLHLAGYCLFDSLARGSYTRGAVIRDFELAAEPYWQEMWESLSPLAQAHLPSTLVKTTDGMTARQLRILANRGLVVFDGEGFQPFSEGFARWLARMQAAARAAEAAATV